MAHIPEFCGVCKGARPRHFCKTENRYICNDCIKFCHRLAHNWKELEDDKGGKEQETRTNLSSCCDSSWE